MGSDDAGLPTRPARIHSRWSLEPWWILILSPGTNLSLYTFLFDLVVENTLIINLIISFIDVDL